MPVTLVEYLSEFQKMLMFLSSLYSLFLIFLILFVYYLFIIINKFIILDFFFLQHKIFHIYIKRKQKIEFIHFIKQIFYQNLITITFSCKNWMYLQVQCQWHNRVVVENVKWNNAFLKYIETVLRKVELEEIFNCSDKPPQTTIYSHLGLGSSNCNQDFA
jgi:hypothetical protein